MYRIINANHIWKNDSLSSQDDLESGRRFLAYKCASCETEIEYQLKHLDKHRFLDFSNLTEKDQKIFNKISLSFLPYNLIHPKRQNSVIKPAQIILIKLQKIYLTLIFGRKLMQVQTISKWLPDSFIDFYCPKCTNPARINYGSYFGGKIENGYKLSYVIEKIK